MDLCEIPAGSYQRHPWELSRLAFFTRLLRDRGVLAGTRRVLDAGASDGWVSRQLLAELPTDARVVCLDAFYTPEQLVQFNAAGGGAQTFTADWPPGSFNLLLLLDVLEHVEDDAGFLRRLVGALNPGAAALISVPAWQELYSVHDKNLHHFRRYSPSQALGVLRGSGLTVEAHGGLFHSLLVARTLQWMKERILPPSAQPVPEHQGVWNHGALLTGAVQGALAVDNRLSRMFERRGLDIPGLSWWAFCRKSVV